MRNKDYPINSDRIKSGHRIDALFAGRTWDHVRLYLFLLSTCTKNVGYPITTIHSDPQKSFEAQLLTQEEYGFDGGPFFGYASYGTWGFGDKIEMPESSYEKAPIYVSFPSQSEEEIDRLGKPDVRTSDFLPLAMEFSRLQLKHKTVITLILDSSFTSASNICLLEILYRWLLRKPELVYRLLRLATNHIVDAVKYWANTFGSKQVIPQIWESLAKNDIIFPKQFERFLLPYLQELSKRIYGLGIKHIFYHICGQQSLNPIYWIQVSKDNPSICSASSQIEASTTIKYFGDKPIITGNIASQMLLTNTLQ